nr:MAG TPA: hypothetical protein [Caudoviricetes sp.]
MSSSSTSRIARNCLSPFQTALSDTTVFRR